MNSPTSRKGSAGTVLSLLFITVTFVPIILGLYFNPIQFNQLAIQRARLYQNSDAITQVWRTLGMLWRSGKSYLLAAHLTVPDYYKTEDMFEYVFSMVPDYAIVYPTEGFYYWNTEHPAIGSISGNIRLADIGDKQSLSFAYFPVGKRWFNKDNIPTQSLNLNAAKGLSATSLGNQTFMVSYRGKSKVFKLPVEAQVSNLNLSQNEEFIGKIVDESGLVFDLIYNSDTRSFYDILDERLSLGEGYFTLEHNVLLGKRTKFAYVFDEALKRKILVGVHEDNSKTNNYFDGPGDQVPFWLDLKEKINLAYPATLLGDGIDQHGVYLNKSDWTRIAITPFQIYSSPKTLLSTTTSCKAIAARYNYSTCLTKEWWNNSQWLQGVKERFSQELKPVPFQVDDKITRSQLLERTLHNQ